MEQVTVKVPRGISRKKGEWARKATIHGLTGFDEQHLAEFEGAPHSRALALLERIVRFQSMSQRSLSRLSLGDRAFLLLAARRIIVGDLIECTIDCPSCESTMSADFSIADLLKQDYPELKESYSIEACGFNMRIRPLTIADQEKLSSEHIDRRSRVQMLARACITRSRPALPKDLPEDLLEAVGTRVGELDPLSNIVLTSACPECGGTFHTSFPVEEFILNELVPTQQLDRDVHWLAFHYHWTEKEILSLPATRRKKYIELVNATLEGEGK